MGQSHGSESIKSLTRQVRGFGWSMSLKLYQTLYVCPSVMKWKKLAGWYFVKIVQVDNRSISFLEQLDHIISLSLQHGRHCGQPLQRRQCCGLSSQHMQHCGPSLQHGRRCGRLAALGTALSDFITALPTLQKTPYNNTDIVVAPYNNTEIAVIATLT